MADNVIADLNHAILQVIGDNEIGFDQKGNPDGTPTLNDPIKFRLGAWLPDGSGYIGTLSFDVLRTDGRRNEAGFLKLAVDEHVDHDGDPVPMVELFLTRDPANSVDGEMQRVVTLSRKAAVFHVPVIFEQGSGAGTLPSGKVSRFYSDDGRYVYNVQGDPTPDFPHGRIVQYDTHHSADETTWTPVAILRPEPL